MALFCTLGQDSSLEEEEERVKGRFSHVADVAFDNTLLIVGGYRGNVLGDMIAYTVPTTVAKNWVSFGMFFLEVEGICAQLGRRK